MQPAITAEVARLTAELAEAKARIRELETLAETDALLEILNRRGFERAATRAIAYLRRYRGTAALIVLDVDRLKAVNDTLGHAAGDAVLKRACEACSRGLRTEDVFARFGGEEFAIVLRGVDSKGAARLGERLRQAVAAEVVEHEGQRIQITLSAGAASLADCRAPSAEELIAVADRRLYVAKQAGRNRIVAEG